MKQKRNNRSISLIGSSITTIVSISLVLFLLGLTFFVTIMGREISSFIKENITITVELSDKLSDAAVGKLQKELGDSPYVRNVTLITKDQVKKELIEELGGDPEEILGYVPTSNYFDINLKSEYANTDSIKVVEKSLKGKKIVKSFLYSQETLDMINSNLSKVITGLFILSLLLLVISVTLIRNTIKLNIYSKRFLINTMQLVGATNGFIRRPFMVKTATLGIIAAILANLAIVVLVYNLTQSFPELMSIVDVKYLGFLLCLILLLGILLPVIATAMAVNRYLRMNTNNLYNI